MCWLKFAAGATLADFGIVPRKLAGDVRLGLLAFLAVTPPVYAVLFAVQELLPEDGGCRSDSAALSRRWPWAGCTAARIASCRRSCSHRHSTPSGVLLDACDSDRS